MAYKRVVVLGAGPIGLLCAIEAKQQGFRQVYLVEKRPEYTRPNVPQLYTKPLTHIQSLVPGQIPFDVQNLGNVPFKGIESPLLAKAEALGVIVKRGYFATDVIPASNERFGRYKSMTLILKKWDQAKKQVDPFQAAMIKANLLIVATGGHAATDRIVTGILGFDYEHLKPVNYMALGLFNRGRTVGGLKDGKADPLYEQAEAAREKIAEGQICFQTAQYDYLLSNLSGITKTDFNNIKQNQAYLRDLVIALRRGSTRSTGVREELKQVQDNLGAFEIKIQRARILISEKYPAVVVGDAAVTPHPDTGMGVTSGFQGFEELRKLMAALKKNEGLKDDSAEYASFNASYEQHVSQKALEGTISICENNISLLQVYREKLRELTKEGEEPHPWLTRGFQADLNRCDRFIRAIKASKGLAETYHKYAIAWDNGPSEMWNNLANLWTIIDRLTEQKELLPLQLKALEDAVGFQGDRHKQEKTELKGSVKVD